MSRAQISALMLVCITGPLGAEGTASRPAATTTAPAETRYSFREKHDPNGIGKFYMGREIAHVMGHEGAEWLERPEREREEQPRLLLDALKLRRGDVAVDLGSGTGYFTTRIAERVGATGRVLAVDIQPEMLDLLKLKLRREDIHNVELILGGESDPKLPAASADLVLMVDVYHEFEYPYEMMQHIVRALKPGGRVVFVEFRLEDPEVPIKLVHKMSEQQVRKEMEPFDLIHEETNPVLPRQHILIFRKPEAASRPTP